MATILIADSPWFPLIGQYMAYFGVSVVLIGFVVLFILGTLLLGLRRQDEWTGYSRKIESLEKQREKLEKRRARTRNMEEGAALSEKIRKIDQLIEHLRSRR